MENINRPIQYQSYYKKLSLWRKILIRIKYKWWSLVPYKWRPHNLWYYYKCKIFHPYNVIKIRSLPPTWMDIDTRLEHSIMQLLVDFVEKEEPQNHFNYAVYAWYGKSEWVSEQDIIDNQQHINEWKEIFALYRWCKKFIKLNEKDNIENKIKNYKIILNLNERFDKLVTQKLIRIIQLRGHLWT